MKKYKIKHNNKEYLVEGSDLIQTLTSFCREKYIDLNNVQSCELIDEQKTVTN